MGLATPSQGSRADEEVHRLGKRIAVIDPKLNNERALRAIYFSITHRNTQLYLLGLQSYRLWRLERV